MFELKQNETSAKLFFFFTLDFLSDRKERVALNGRCFYWMNVQVGVPQDSILGTFFNSY